IWRTWCTARRESKRESRTNLCSAWPKARESRSNIWRCIKKVFYLNDDYRERCRRVFKEFFFQRRVAGIPARRGDRRARGPFDALSFVRDEKLLQKMLFMRIGVAAGREAV